jgi:DNA-binding CsgD family transcriptional regulator
METEEIEKNIDRVVGKDGVRIYYGVLHLPDLSHTEKELLNIVISKRSGLKASDAEIAYVINRTEPRVNMLLKDLQAKDYIAIVNRTNNRRTIFHKVNPSILKQRFNF